MAPLDPEFAQAALVQRIVRGAAEDDPVRLHGAILAALDLHPPGVAVAGIFAPALREAGRNHGHPCRSRIAAAIRDHLGIRQGQAGDAPARCASD
ncbi:MAG TPA: hypothetical protein VGL44_12865 [Gaiellales bacterium]|jgi:hypothetical protein